MPIRPIPTIISLLALSLSPVALAVTAMQPDNAAELFGFLKWFLGAIGAFVALAVTALAGFGAKVITGAVQAWLKSQKEGMDAIVTAAKSVPEKLGEMNGTLVDFKEETQATVREEVGKAQSAILAQLQAHRTEKLDQIHAAIRESKPAADLEDTLPPGGAASRSGVPRKVVR